MFLDITRIASGQLIGQIFLLISLPIISRYYSPEDFGVFAVFSSIIWILVAISSAKAESLIITMKSRERAFQLTIEICILIFLASLIMGIILVLLKDTEVLQSLSKIDYLPFLFSLTIVFVGFSQTLRSYVTYLGKFNAHGVASILNAIGIIIVSIGFAKFLPNSYLPVGLILGQLFGQFLSFLIFAYYSELVINLDLNNFIRPFYLIIGLLRKIPILLITQIAFVLSLSFPTLIINSVGGLASAGALAMASRIISMPTSTLGPAVGQVFRHRFASIHKKDSKNLTFPRVVISTTFLLAILVYGLAFLLSDIFVPFFLGKQWISAIFFVKAIIVMEVFNFVYYAVEDLAIIRDKFSYRMWSQLLQLFALVIMYFYVLNSDNLLSVDTALILIVFFRISFVVFDIKKSWKNNGTI